jgi:hypothetical protein
MWLVGLILFSLGCSLLTPTPAPAPLEIVISTIPASAVATPVPVLASQTPTPDPCRKELLQAVLDEKASEEAGQPTSWVRVVKSEEGTGGCQAELEPRIGVNRDTWYSIQHLLREILSEETPQLVYQYTEGGVQKWSWFSDLFVHPEKQVPPLTLVAILANVSNPLEFFVWPSQTP